MTMLYIMDREGSLKYSRLSKFASVIFLGSNATWKWDNYRVGQKLKNFRFLFYQSVSGKKFSASSRRLVGSSTVTNNKSQTLPRSMGRSQPVLHRPSLVKPSSLTPPSVKRQFSVPGANESPLRRRPTTPNSNSTPAAAPTVNNNKFAGRKAPLVKGVEPKLAQVIMDEILEGGPPVLWSDIAGQEVTNCLALFKKKEKRFHHRNVKMTFLYRLLSRPCRRWLYGHRSDQNFSPGWGRPREDCCCSDRRVTEKLSWRALLPRNAMPLFSPYPRPPLRPSTSAKEKNSFEPYLRLLASSSPPSSSSTKSTLCWTSEKITSTKLPGFFFFFFFPPTIFILNRTIFFFPDVWKPNFWLNSMVFHVILKREY